MSLLFRSGQERTEYFSEEDIQSGDVVLIPEKERRPPRLGDHLDADDMRVLNTPKPLEGVSDLNAPPKIVSNTYRKRGRNHHSNLELFYRLLMA